MNEHGSNGGMILTGKVEVFGREKPIPVPLGPPQILYGLN